MIENDLYCQPSCKVKQSTKERVSYNTPQRSQDWLTFSQVSASKVLNFWLIDSTTTQGELRYKMDLTGLLKKKISTLPEPPSAGHAA